MVAWGSRICSDCTTGSSGSASIARSLGVRNAVAKRQPNCKDGRCMPEIDIESLRSQLGRKVVDEDVATAAPLRGMVVTFGREETAPGQGQPVPPGWHLAYFPDASRLSTLGADGLP